MSKNLAFIALLAVAGVTIWGRSGGGNETAPTIDVPKAERVTWISQGGAAVEITDHLPDDAGWTIIEFTGDW